MGNGLIFCARHGKSTDTPTDEQIARLDALGMIWEDRVDKLWNDSFQALCKYYSEHKTLKVPEDFKTKKELSLTAG